MIRILLQRATEVPSIGSMLINAIACDVADKNKMIPLPEGRLTAGRTSCTCARHGTNSRRTSGETHARLVGVGEPHSFQQLFTRGGSLVSAPGG